MQKGKHQYLFLGLFLVFAALAGGIQHRIVQSWRGQIEQYRDSLYLPSGEYMQAVTFGYDQWSAHFLWLRMIQTFAAGWSRPENADQMMAYFEVVSDLDPLFLPVYSFAIMGVGEQAERDDYVIDIVRKAAVNLPANHKVAYEGAFYAFWNMEDPDLAKYFVKLALRDEDHPDFLARWPRYFDLKAGRYHAAYEKYALDYLHALKGAPDHIQGLLNDQLRRAVDEWILSELRPRVTQWYEQNGEWPTIEQIEQSGQFRQIELPDWNRLLRLIEQVESADVLDVTDQELLQLIRSTVRTWDHVPPSPYDDMIAGFDGYRVWPLPEQPVFEDRTVLANYQLLLSVQQIVEQVNDRIEIWKSEQGELPDDYTELLPLLENVPEPFGGQWLYSPENEKFSTSTFPGVEEMELPDA